MIILGAQIELPSNEFAKNETISSDYFDLSYQVPPLTSLNIGHKYGASNTGLFQDQEELPQIIGFKSPLTIPVHYLKVYDQFKPRDFYLII